MYMYMYMYISIYTCMYMYPCFHAVKYAFMFVDNAAPDHKESVHAAPDREERAHGFCMPRQIPLQRARVVYQAFSNNYRHIVYQAFCNSYTHNLL